MKHLLKKLMDVLYLYPIRIKGFKGMYPNDKIVAFGACKGIKLDSEEDVKRGINWALSKRGLFILSDNRITLNDWVIEVNNIDKAELLQYRSGMILKIKETDGTCYQYGLQYNKELLKQETLKIDLISEKVRYSFFSVLVRIMLVAYTVFLISTLI